MKTKETLLLQGVQLHYEHHIIDSQQPTIIFLHDSLGCVTLWRDFPLQLAAQTNCNILCYDRQGYGQSAPFDKAPRDWWYMHQEADTLQALIKALQLKEIILFGHSDGGTIALLYAAKYKEYLKGIIVEGAHVLIEDITLQGIKTFEQAYATTNLKEKLIKYHGDKTEEVFQRWTKTWQQPAFRNWNIRQELTAIQCPTLVIQGVDDAFGSIKQVETIVNYIDTKGYFYIVNHAEHTPHKEQPATTLHVTTTFIEGIN